MASSLASMVPVGDLPITAGRPFHSLLDDVAVAGVRGADALKFLHSMTTNRFDDFSSGARFAGWADAKGRLQALFLAVRPDPGFDGALLLLPRSMLPLVMKRLRLYIMRSKVVLAEEVGLEVAGFVGAGKIAPGLSVPEGVMGCIVAGNAFAVRLSDTGEGVAPVEKGLARTVVVGKGLREALRGETRSKAAWRLASIAAGSTTVVPETAGLFLPQSLNLDLVGGVSFNKGCYPGQEVISRLHFRGNPARARVVALEGGREAAAGFDVEMDGKPFRVASSVAAPGATYAIVVG